MSLKPTYAGEMQFRRYSDTSTQGQTVTFTLPDREALAAFIGREGKRYQAVFVEINDQEEPVPPSTPSTFRKAPVSSNGPACTWLVMRGKDDVFLRWAARQFTCASDENTVAAVCRHICGVESRKDIDGDPVAMEAFERVIRKPYLAFTRQPA